MAAMHKHKPKQQAPKQLTGGDFVRVPVISAAPAAKCKSSSRGLHLLNGIYNSRSSVSEQQMQLAEQLNYKQRQPLEVGVDFRQQQQQQQQVFAGDHEERVVLIFDDDLRGAIPVIGRRLPSKSARAVHQQQEQEQLELQLLRRSAIYSQQQQQQRQQRQDVMQQQQVGQLPVTGRRSHRIHQQQQQQHQTHLMASSRRRSTHGDIIYPSDEQPVKYAMQLTEAQRSGAPSRKSAATLLQAAATGGYPSLCCSPPPPPPSGARQAGACPDPRCCPPLPVLPSGGPLECKNPQCCPQLSEVMPSDGGNRRVRVSSRGHAKGGRRRAASCAERRLNGAAINAASGSSGDKPPPPVAAKPQLLLRTARATSGLLHERRHHNHETRDKLAPKQQAIDIEANAAVTQMYESLAAELKAKLGNPKTTPILLPPRDYDTLTRRQGKLTGIELRRSTNPQLVGPAALIAMSHHRPSQSSVITESQEMAGTQATRNEANLDGDQRGACSSIAGSRSNSSSGLGSIGLCASSNSPESPVSSSMDSSASFMGRHSSSSQQKRQPKQQQTNSNHKQLQAQRQLTDSDDSGHNHNCSSSPSLAEGSASLYSASACGNNSHCADKRLQVGGSCGASGSSNRSPSFTCSSSLSSSSPSSSPSSPHSPPPTTTRQTLTGNELQNGSSSSSYQSKQQHRGKGIQHHHPSKVSDGVLWNGRVEIPLKVNSERNGNTYLATKQIIY